MTASSRRPFSFFHPRQAALIIFNPLVEISGTRNTELVTL
jgi:hypothetical protein